MLYRTAYAYRTSAVQYTYRFLLLNTTMQLSRLLDYQDDYLQNLTHQGKSAYTVAAYRRDLTQLASLLPCNHIQEPVKPKHFTAALKNLSQQNTSSRSMARKLSAWRQYCGWLVKQGLLDTDPTKALKAPKLSERLPKALGEEMLNHLLDRRINDKPLNVRDHALFELAYGSGLRIGEITALNLNDVLLNDGWVNVTGKGNKQRHVPLTAKSIQAISAYLLQRIAANDETALFTNRLGKRLSARQIQNRLRDWALIQNSPQHISPHMLRHSYASHLLQSAQNIRAIQELLGHSNLSTTQIYTKLDFDHLAQVYDDAHPRSKCKKK